MATRTLFCFLFLFGFASLQGWTLSDVDPLAARVVIVVNERDPESVKVGEHYAERRGIPRENILAIDAPLAETITRQEYLDSIHNPLQRQLIENNWFRGVTSRLKDSEGRSRNVIEGQRIAYLVLCRGVPLRVKNDPARVTPEMREKLRKEFLTNAASVDSELAVMTAPIPFIGPVPNPLFQKKRPGPLDLGSIIKVARLDGPTAADAMALVDNAIEGERLGLRGRAYVDLAGPHSSGDEWLGAAADRIRSLGYDIGLHEAKGVFPLASRFDAPVLYLGWYSESLSGPFLLDDFRFPPGAVAFHIHSFSARTLRSATDVWGGPLVSRGATVTLGNVYEPYLAATHRPDLFLEWVSEGGNIGDAAAYAISALSWQGVLVGDPLYRPFALSLEKQLAALNREESDAWGAYAVIRQINLLAAKGRQEEAVKLGLKNLERQPHPALAVTVAKMQVDARDHRKAIRTLRMLGDAKEFSPMEAMLAKEVADLLSSLNEQKRAFRMYEILLKESRLPAEVKKLLLQDGLLLAQRIGERKRADQWRAELGELE